jgi:hypothetical protein
MACQGCSEFLLLHSRQIALDAGESFICLAEKTGNWVSRFQGPETLKPFHFETFLTRSIQFRATPYLFDSTKSTVLLWFALTTTGFSHVLDSLKTGRCTLCSVSTS